MPSVYRKLHRRVRAARWVGGVAGATSLVTAAARRVSIAYERRFRVPPRLPNLLFLPGGPGVGPPIGTLMLIHVGR